MAPTDLSSKELILTDSEVRWLRRMPEALQLLIDRYHVDIAEADSVGVPECVKYDEQRQKTLAAERDARLVERGDAPGELDISSAHEPCRDDHQADYAAALREIANGPPCTMNNDEVAAWASQIARAALSTPPRPAPPPGDDARRLDLLEHWLANSKKCGFQWDTFRFETDKTVRERLDELIALHGFTSTKEVRHD